MLMVIFGAGASYDSILSSPPPASLFRPPLTNDLFTHHIPWRSNLINGLDHLLPLTHTFPRGESAKDFESELRAWRDRTKDKSVADRALFALRYFLFRLFSECSREFGPSVSDNATNYLRLLEKLDQWSYGNSKEVYLTTFNYDTLLDKACIKRFDLELSSLEGYIKHPRFKLLRPHGCVGWGHMAAVVGAPFGPWNSPEYVNSVVKAFGRSGMTLKSEYHVNPGAGSNSFPNGEILIPAIAIPLPTKEAFEFPSRHLGVLQEAIPKVTRLIVIGWRATEPHFMELWKGRCRPDIKAIIVNGDSSGGPAVHGNVAKSNLEAIGIRGAKVLTMGFSEFVSGSEIEGFLEN
jgi:hypothetical protein